MSQKKKIKNNYLKSVRKVYGQCAQPLTGYHAGIVPLLMEAGVPSSNPGKTDAGCILQTLISLQ